jgi:hypothetical protein
MDPFEKYDIFFNGAVSARTTRTSPGKYAGEDNGWAISLLDEALMQFNRSIVKYQSIARFPGGASNDLLPRQEYPKQPPRPAAVVTEIGQLDETSRPPTW